MEQIQNNITIYWRLFSLTPWSDNISWSNNNITVNENKKYLISTINYYSNYSKITYYKILYYYIVIIKDVKEQFIKYFNSKDKYFNISPLLTNNYIDDKKYFLAPVYINRNDKYLIIGIFLLDPIIINNLYNTYTKNITSYNLISLINFNINRPKQSLTEKIRNNITKSKEILNVSSNLTTLIKYNIFSSLLYDVKGSNIVTKFNNMKCNELLSIKIKYGNNENKDIERNIIDLLLDIRGYLPTLYFTIDK